MNTRKEKVAVVGIGYVGLPVACIFAEQGFKTVGIDLIRERVEMVNRGLCPIGGEEPGLAELLKDVVDDSLLSASTDMSSISDADLVVVCVDTPVGDDKKPTLSNLKGAVDAIASNMKGGALISIESTIPPGTMERMVIPSMEEVSGKRAGIDFFVVHCPERVMPGRLLANLREYKRVLGGLDETSLSKATYYYSTFVEDDIIPTTLVNAEICKTGENAYRDVQIAFANEMALICEDLGADVFAVRDLINSCPFRDMHIPGSGVGGYCLPKDSWLLLGNVENDVAKIIRNARLVNEYMPSHLAGLAMKALNHVGIMDTGVKVAIMGLSFIRDSDDTRNSPALKVIEELPDTFTVLVHDPYVTGYDGLEVSDNAAKVLKDADCAIFVTDHSCYSRLDLDSILKDMRTPIIIDGRNIFDAEELAEKGFSYYGLGKGRKA